MTYGLIFRIARYSVSHCISKSLKEWTSKIQIDMSNVIIFYVSSNFMKYKGFRFEYIILRNALLRVLSV